MTVLYRLYQLFIALPLGIVLTVLTALAVAVGCTLGDGHFWGYYPGRWWSRALLRLLLIPVTVEGREHLREGESYVFVANHQGAFDIFLVYGHLGRSFKWMMKRSLRKLPFVGYACAKSHQVFVDKRGPSRIRQTYEEARSILRDGTSLTVFPEGARTFTGHMARFRKGAFALADELQLPVVPLTINGSFDIMPRQRDGHFAVWHPLKLTIHEPLRPASQGAQNVESTMQRAYETIMGALEPQYQGYVENPDQ